MFAGRSKDFPFSCPNVDPSQEAVLQFQHRGSMQALTIPPQPPGGTLEDITREHPVVINRQELFGGIPAAPFLGSMPLWSTRLLIVQPGVLRRENVLHIMSTPGVIGLDDFTIDNVVIFYKTPISAFPFPAKG
jgi:hypothetical protein